jgi:hypothetical protein
MVRSGTRKRITRAILRRGPGAENHHDHANWLTLFSGAVRGAGKMKIHPATRSFQALRIEVNQELAELETALAAAEQSAETRRAVGGGHLPFAGGPYRIKEFMRARSQTSRCDRFRAIRPRRCLRGCMRTRDQRFILTPTKAIAPIRKRGEPVTLERARQSCAVPPAPRVQPMLLHRSSCYDECSHPRQHGVCGGASPHRRWVYLVKYSVQDVQRNVSDT